MLLLFLFSLAFSWAIAAEYYKNQEKIPGASSQTDCLPTYLKQIIGFGFAVVGILAMFMICVGAYQYLMAAGNIGKVENAKETIASALLGLVLGLTAWIILHKINPDLVSLNEGLCSGSASLGGIGGGGGGGGGSSSAPTSAPSPGKPGAGAGKCIEGTGECSEANLSCFGNRAKDASIVCTAESGGSAGVGSSVDKCGGQSVSWGLMQVNVSCHNIGGLDCKNAFSCCYNGRSCNRNNCQITNSSIANQCAAAAQDPKTNIEYACGLYNKSGFRPWGAARKCKVDLSKG